MTDASAQDVLVELLAEALADIEDAAASIEERLRRVGFEPPGGAGLGTAFSDLADSAQAVRVAALAVEDDEDLPAAATLAAAVVDALRAVGEIGGRLRSTLDGGYLAQSGIATDLPRRLADDLLVQALRRHAPIGFRLLAVLGLVDIVGQDEDLPRHRLAATYWRIEWERMATVVTDPWAAFSAGYTRAGAFDIDKLIVRLALLMSAIGLPIGLSRQDDRVADALGR